MNKKLYQKGQKSQESNGMFHSNHYFFADPFVDDMVAHYNDNRSGNKPSIFYTKL